MEENLITGIITAIGTFIGYIVGARKSNAETDKIVIENVKEILEVYSTTINDLKEEVKELKEKISHYEGVIEKLNHDIDEFRKQIKNATTQRPTRTRPKKSNP
jgi:predicted RNase H-like nuclease (RuvC/YqgF family)